jgi:CheY-like chemotaxis protein/signal transduction histidine kinase/HPt (histidine-containing phosphotransfer) domain-containing protein
VTLGIKIVVLFLVLGVSLSIGTYAALNFAIYPIFSDFERETSEVSAMRVMQALEGDLHALGIFNGEYAFWDHTYEYAQGQRPEYTDENLEDEYWYSIDIDMFLIFDSQGNKLYGSLAHPADGSVLSLEEEIEQPLVPGHPLVIHAATSSMVQGFLQTATGLMHVVSKPILTTDREGPIVGSVVTGQFIDDKQVTELAKRTTAEFSLSAANTMDASVMQTFLNSDEMQYFEITDESVLEYRLLLDLFGAPAGVLEVTTPRRITSIGSSTVDTAMFFLFAASAIFLLAAWLFMQRQIVGPVKRLTQQMLDIQETGNLQIEVGSNRSDEVGVMAGVFGKLTSRLSQAQQESERARDEALATSKAKSEFLARMSHEIRTPMNGVLGMTELLRDTSLSDKQQRFAKTIYESGESLLHIINDILDISKIEAGKIELDIAPFNLQHLVEECLELLAESAHRKGLELACAIPAGTKVNVRGDPVRLRQIMMNLVGNALKFTEQGEVVVRVAEAQDDAGKAIYRFEIEDTGIGISLENSAKVFEPFVQEDGSNTRRYGGTGLGLSISKQLVNLMGGEIGVRSAIGKGSIFWFTAELIEDQVTAAHSQPYLLSGKTAFVVDDNQTNREILRHQIEAWGMQVEVACSGSEAMRILRDRDINPPRFDIILLDMAMPGMDGLQLARAIRNEHEHRSTPIVMLSSISRADIDQENSATGPVDWLAKPVRQARLYDTLLSLVSKSVVDRSDDPCEDNCDSDSDDTASMLTEGGMKILLVDDNEVNLTVAKEMLNSLGHQATIATNGREAVIAYKAQTVDAVLMDCQMPEMDGFEATQEIRDWEAEQGRKPTPIIALTAHALRGDRETCIAAGMNDYLSKPFTKLSLSAVLSDNTQMVDATTDEDHRTIADPSSPAVAQNRSGSQARILVVDDNDINRQVAQSILENLGYETESAENGDEALRAMARRPFDAILMDCHMPVRNGYDTTKEIRLREDQSPQVRRIPIVAVTADLLQNNRQRCFDSGMDDYLGKPYTLEQLRVILDRWLTNTDDEKPTEVTVGSDGFSELGETPALASIDRAALDEILQLDKSTGAVVLREIVVSYRASSTKLMLQLRSAVADADTELVEQLAHSLKGGSGQLGATLFASLCEDMISSIRANDLDGLTVQFERAAIEHSAVLSGLDQELQNIAA